jgi:hypothetical protein
MMHTTMQPMWKNQCCSHRGFAGSSFVVGVHKRMVMIEVVENDDDDVSRYPQNNENHYHRSACVLSPKMIFAVVHQDSIVHSTWALLSHYNTASAAKIYDDQPLYLNLRTVHHHVSDGLVSVE